MSTAAEYTPTPLEQTIAMMIASHFPKLTGHLHVRVRPRAPYLYHAHKLDDGTVIVKTSIKLNSLRELEACVTIGRSCLEILERRTNAVAVQEHERAA